VMGIAMVTFLPTQSPHEVIKIETTEAGIKTVIESTIPHLQNYNVNYNFGIYLHTLFGYVFN